MSDHQLIFAVYIRTHAIHMRYTYSMHVLWLFGASAVFLRKAFDEARDFTEDEPPLRETHGTLVNQV